MEIQKAKQIANSIIEQLQPDCDIINIAGSIRRTVDYVSDIEIVCSPCNELVQKMELFAEPKYIRAPAFISKVKKLGKILTERTYTKTRIMQVRSYRNKMASWSIMFKLCISKSNI